MERWIRIMNSCQIFRYSVCIRQEQGFCCVQYQVCPDIAVNMGAFALGAAAAGAQTDNACNEDYLGITGSANSCIQQANNAMLTDRYCGANFNTLRTATVNIQICGKRRCSLIAK